MDTDKKTPKNIYKNLFLFLSMFNINTADTKVIKVTNIGYE